MKGVSHLTLLCVKDTGMGLKAVKKIANQHQLTGVYGPLYNLFEIPDDKFNTAIELTAGNRQQNPIALSILLLTDFLGAQFVACRRRHR